MKLELPDLPFAKESLDPHMSANTLDFHHGKHHNAYVVKGNELLESADISADNLEDLVKESAKVGRALYSTTWVNITTTAFSGTASAQVVAANPQVQLQQLSMPASEVMRTLRLNS